MGMISSWPLSHLVNVGDGELGIPQGLLNGDLASIEKVGAHLLKLGPGKVGVNVLGALRGGGDEGQVDRGLAHTRQLNLGLLSSLRQPM